MKKKFILLSLVLTCTLLCSVGCGRRMNSATDGTNKNDTTTPNTTVEENYNDNMTNDTLDNEFNDNVINDTNNGNVVDGVMDGVEDTVNGITNGVEDVVDGVDDSVHNMTEPNNVNTPSTGTNNTSR